MPANTQPGPLVNGRPTTARSFSRDALASSDLLPGVISLINAAFPTGQSREYFPAHHKRIEGGSQQLLAELGEGGQFLVLSFDEPSTGDDLPHGLLATGLSMPTLAHDGPEKTAMLDGLDEVDYWFHRHGEAAKLIPGVSDWDVKLMAVAPRYARRGLASVMLTMLENDIRQRSSGNRDSQIHPVQTTVDSLAKPSASNSRIRIRITTRAEDLEGFYLKRGFETVGRTEIPAGDAGIGGRIPLSIAHMDKWL